jgi:hypothetical protein
VGLFPGWIGVIIMLVISTSPETKLREQETARRAQIDRETRRVQDGQPNPRLPW